MVDLDKRKLSQSDVSFNPKRRYDVLVTAKNRGYRLTEKAAHALIVNFKTNYWIRPFEEKITDDWVEVYCTADSTSHELFTPKGFPQDVPVFLEAVFRFGQEGSNPGYGPGFVYFYIEFRGCVFKDPMGPFKKLFKDMLAIPPEISTRLHTAIPPRPVVEEEEEEG